MLINFRNELKSDLSNLGDFSFREEYLSNEYISENEEEKCEDIQEISDSSEKKEESHCPKTLEERGRKKKVVQVRMIHN